jgi:hypothetical protein
LSYSEGCDLSLGKERTVNSESCGCSHPFAIDKTFRLEETCIFQTVLA